MKISIGMKSNFAFERLKTTLSNFKYAKDVQLYKENILTLELLEDVVELWQPELIILDSKLSTFDELDIFASQKEIEVVYFNSDFDAVLNHVLSFFETEEERGEAEKQIKDIHYVKNEVQTEVIVKDRIVEKEVIKTAYTSIPNKLIVIASMWDGAGSTTLATNLARALATRGMNVSYVEFPLSKPYMFDYLSIPAKEEQEEKKYIDYARQIAKGESIKRKEDSWKDFDIDWFVNDSRYEKSKKFTYEQMLKLVYSINSSITIVDVSTNLHNPDVQTFLHHADDIYVCVDPDPVKVDWLASIDIGDGEKIVQRNEKMVIDFLDNIEQKEGITYQFVNMKYTKMIDNKSLWDSLGKKPIVFFPVINYETLISLVWDSKFLYDLIDYQETVEKALKPIIVRSIPRQYYEINKAQPNGIKNFLKAFKKGEK